MSTLEKNQNVWSALSKDSVDSKYEKCLNITEEIYKRINITFQIKKLEATQSDLSEQSDQIDSNELSNETDLFACDKSDSIPSSTDERPHAHAACEKYININNNEEMKKKAAVVYKRPRKRFRKRVKKRQSKQQSDSDGSSDEAPLSRIVELDTKCVAEEWESPDNVMGVPKIIIVTKDLKPKILSPETKSAKKPSKSALNEPAPTPEVKKNEGIDKIDSKELKTIDKGATAVKEKTHLETKNCTMCSLSFRGERGLRRHMTMSHIITEETQRRSRTEQREVNPA